MSSTYCKPAVRTMVTHAPDEKTARTCRCFRARDTRVEHAVLLWLLRLPSFLRSVCIDRL